MKNLVIYHSADFDGIFCREIARKFLPPDTEFIGWNFGDPKIVMPEDTMVYVLDLSPDCLDGVLDPRRLVWIDHHKTSIEKWGSEFLAIPGYRIDGVAACRLAWQWFNRPQPDEPGNELPTKQDYIDHKVKEPWAVRLAGEHDVWDRRDPIAEVLQYGLRVRDPLWNFLLLYPEECTELASKYMVQLVEDGNAARSYAKNVDASICKSLTWVMEWEGLKFLCVNHARFNSSFFAAKDVPETGHDALLGFRWDGKQWMVSLYQSALRKDIDLSVIAKKYGGGGHAGACGFTCKVLPFPL